MKKATGVDNTVRQKWDKDEFKKKAEEREAEEDVSFAFPLFFSLYMAFSAY